MPTTLALLVEPVSPESPCGADLEYTQLLASFDAMRIFGNATPLSPEIDWPGIRQQALTALEQSRDLRILTHLSLAEHLATRAKTNSSAPAAQVQAPADGAAADMNADSALSVGTDRGEIKSREEAIRAIDAAIPWLRACPHCGSGSLVPMRPRSARRSITTTRNAPRSSATPLTSENGSADELDQLEASLKAAPSPAPPIKEAGASGAER